MAKPRNGITTKQKFLVQEYIKTKGNGTQAALRVYDTKDAGVASAIASRELGKENVQEELQRVLQKEDLRIASITNNIASIAVEKPVKGFSGADILEANKTLLKLHGVLTDRKITTSYNLNLDYSKLSQHELLELRSKKLQETNSILAE